MIKKILLGFALLLSAFTFAACDDNSGTKVTLELRKEITISVGDAGFFLTEFQPNLASYLLVKIDGKEVSLSEVNIIPFGETVDVSAPGEGKFTIHVFYLEKQYSFEVEYEVSYEIVNAVIVITPVSGLTIDFDDDSFDYRSLFTITKDGTAVAVTNSMLDISSVDIKVPGTYTVTINYLGSTNTVSVTVLEETGGPEEAVLVHRVDFNTYPTEAINLDKPPYTIGGFSWDMLKCFSRVDSVLSDGGVRLGNASGALAYLKADIQLAKPVDKIVFSACDWVNSQTLVPAGGSVKLTVTTGSGSTSLEFALTGANLYYQMELPEALSSFNLEFSLVDGKRYIVSEVLFGTGNLIELAGGEAGGGGENRDLRDLTAAEKTALTAAFSKSYANMTVLDHMYGFEIVRISNENLQMFDSEGYTEAIIYKEGNALFIDYFDYDAEDYNTQQITTTHELYEFYMFTFNFGLFNINLFKTDGVKFYTEEILDEFCPFLTEDGDVLEIYTFMFSITDGFIDYVAMEYLDGYFDAVEIWELDVLDVGTSVAYDLE